MRYSVLLRHLCMLCAGTVTVLAARSISQGPATGIACTVQYIETSTVPATGVSIQRHMFWSSREDGTTSSGISDRGHMVRTIEDRAAALTVKVADGLKMKTTYDYSYIGVTPPAQKPAPSCLPRGSVYSLVGDERIAGFEAHHYQRLSTLPDGETLEDHDWFAPGLGCFQIQRIQYRRDAKGNLTGVFEKKPVQVQTGEPENSLFMVPDTYREMKPSDLERAVLLQAVEEREGYDAVQRHKIPAGVEQNWARMDSHYLSVKNHTYGAVKKQ